MERDDIEAVLDVLNSMVLQLLDMNSNFGEMLNRVAIERAYMASIVDELRILNSSVGRLEDASLAR